MFRKYCAQSEKTATSPSCKQITQPSGAATPRDSDAHHAHRCPEGFLRSSRAPPGQDPKAAKYAVLIPGHAGFPKRVKRSGGSDTTPIRNAPCFGVCAAVCDFSPKAEGVPAFACESERGHLWEKLKIGMRNGWWIKFMRQLCRIIFFCWC